MKIWNWISIILPLFSYSQVTIMVKEPDSVRMICYPNGDCFFKEKLPDGHYIAYRYNDTLNIDKEITFMNEKKNGLESRYSFDGVHKYLEINWVNGKKNGPQIHFGGNGDILCIQYRVVFKNDIIDGPIFVNLPTCQKQYTGYYKNGYRDSIWTYYETDGITLDSSKYWRSKEYRYIKGIPLLVSAWNKQGIQTVINGTGAIIDSDSYRIKTTNYLNGMKNGKQIETRLNGGPSNIRLYQDNLLVKEEEYTELDFDTSTFIKTNFNSYYAANSYLSSVSEWNYPKPPKVIKEKNWVDTYITDIFYTEIRKEFNPVPNGYRASYFPGGIVAFEGNYENGKRVGVWNWNYLNGKQRMKVDYKNKTYKHFDTLGNFRSDFHKEYLTQLVSTPWYVINGEKIDSLKTLKLEKYADQSNFSFYFQLEGNIKINAFNYGYKDWYYEIMEDVLTIKIPDYKTGKIKRALRFRIVSANDEKISLKRID